MIARNEKSYDRILSLDGESATDLSFNFYSYSCHQKPAIAMVDQL